MHEWLRMRHSAAIGVVVLFGIGALVGVVGGGRLADPLLDRGHVSARIVVATFAYLAAAVLFLGRMTMQKGPAYFLYAAKRVLEKQKNVRFIMAGDGDRLYGTVELAAWLGIGHRVLFTRFLRGSEVDQAYRMADLYGMPSVSEPFGIAPLAALRHHVPALISKQSGVAETLHHALKVDFWDVNEMANRILSVLRHSSLRQLLGAEGRRESMRFRWEDAAKRLREIDHATLWAAPL